MMMMMIGQVTGLYVERMKEPKIFKFKIQKLNTKILLLYRIVNINLVLNLECSNFLS